MCIIFQYITEPYTYLGFYKITVLILTLGLTLSLWFPKVYLQFIVQKRIHATVLF